MSYHFFILFRHHVRLQRPPISIGVVFGLRDEVREIEADQRFPICWYGHLQCRNFMVRSLTVVRLDKQTILNPFSFKHDHGARHPGDWKPTKRILLLYLLGQFILLLLIHGLDFPSQNNFHSPTCS